MNVVRRRYKEFTHEQLEAVIDQSIKARPDRPRLPVRLTQLSPIGSGFQPNRSRPDGFARGLIAVLPEIK